MLDMLECSEDKIQLLCRHIHLIDLVHVLCVKIVDELSREEIL